jgi:hypothetical protein
MKVNTIYILEEEIMNYFKMSCCGSDIKVIYANNQYEAVGFYVMECQNGPGFIHEIRIEKMSAEEKIEDFSSGVPICKTVEEIYKEKDFWSIPSEICELVE